MSIPHKFDKLTGKRTISLTTYYKSGKPVSTHVEFVRSDDKLYVSTPNLGYLAHRLRMLFGRFPVTYIADPREHLRYWSVKDFIYWSEKLGYSKPDVLGLRGKPGVFKLPARFPSLFASEVVYRFKP